MLICAFIGLILGGLLGFPILMFTGLLDLDSTVEPITVSILAICGLTSPFVCAIIGG
jgi:hypothetical protein